MAKLLLTALEYYNVTFILNENVSTIEVGGYGGIAYGQIVPITDVHYLTTIAPFGFAYGSFEQLNQVYSFKHQGFAGFLSSTWSADYTSEDCFCNGEMSCFGSTFNWTQFINVEIMGLNAMSYTQLNTIDNSNEPEFHMEGALGLYNANFKTGGNGLASYFHSQSFLGGYNTTLEITSGDYLEVWCYSGHSCYNLKVVCDIPSNCYVKNCNKNGTLVCPLGTYNADYAGTVVTVENYNYLNSSKFEFNDFHLFDDYIQHYLLPLFDPLNAANQNNPIYQVKPLQFLDNCLIYHLGENDENSDAEFNSTGIIINNDTLGNYVINSNGSLICWAANMSFLSSIMDFADIDGSYNVLCDAKDSCRDSVFVMSLNLVNSNSLYCRAEYSCYQARVYNGDKLVCSGHSSCVEGAVKDVKEMWCVGAEACYNTDYYITHKSENEQHVLYLLAKDNRVRTVMNNGTNTTLIVVLDGLYGLSSASLYCYGVNTTCLVYCFDDISGEDTCYQRFERDCRTNCQYFMNDYSFIRYVYDPAVGAATTTTTTTTTTTSPTTTTDPTTTTAQTSMATTAATQILTGMTTTSATTSTTGEILEATDETTVETTMPTTTEASDGELRMIQVGKHNLWILLACLAMF